MNAKEISEKVIENQRPDINSINMPESYKNLIQNCWSQEPEKRPSFDQIVNLLKTDESFITKSINKGEYLQYVHFIENEYIKQQSAKENKYKNIEGINQLLAIVRKAKKIEEPRQNSAIKDKDLKDEEEFIIDIDKESFESVKYNIQLEQIRIKIVIRTTCHQFLEMVRNKFKINDISFYLTFNNHLNEVHVLDDDNPICALNTHNFIIHYGEVIHSTKTFIESLINARRINFGDGFSLQTNSSNANYDVEFPPDHDGWLDVPFNITNNSTTSSTDKALISLEMSEKEASFLQKGNTVLHQYLKDDKWVTEDEPVFLSYPDCNTAIFLLNHCSGHRIAILDTAVRKLIPDEYIDDRYSCDWDEMCPHTFFNKGNKDYYVPVDYKSIGIKVNSFDENTCVAFHATKARFVSSIIEKGFILPSKREGVLSGHIPLDLKVFDIDNFADAIFASPSIKYSSKYGKQPIYTKRDEVTYIEAGHIENGLIRILILQVRVKPDSFSIHPNTTPDHQFKDPHFDNDELEWRIGNPKDIFPYRLLFRYYSSLDEFNSDIHSYGQDFQESNSKIFNISPKIISENDHDLVIGIGYRMTELLFNNNKLNSTELTDIVNCFSGFIIEIKYPSKQFDDIYDLILKMKELCQSKIKIRIYICGIKSTGQNFLRNASINYMKLNSKVAEIQCESQAFGDGSFTECYSLEQISILSSVTSIGKFSFFKCLALAYITIPSSVTSIGDFAFSGCFALTQISIPSSVTSIGDCAFFGCYSLKQIEIPPSITSVGKSVFFGCLALTQITIPSSINREYLRDYLRIPSETKIIII
ncbi:hypothetical protein M9Y10_007413 [Tritrichomonas musculus]|uniref:Serine-threonine/tyrosine-protein kinase catalytic domain-containing protein n=1 Tax=Tritrichomonas musculus TaxID=1915356 RepID=A0ABR2J3N5_9EUKA